MGARDTRHAVAETLHKRLEVHGDQRLILDDENVGCGLLGDLLAGLANEVGHFLAGTVHDFGGLTSSEAFERGKKEGLARPRRNCFEAAVRAAFALGGGTVVEGYRVPHLEEAAVEPDAGLCPGRKARRVLDQRLEDRDDVGVAALLAASKGAGKPPQIGKMRCNGFS